MPGATPVQEAKAAPIAVVASRVDWLSTAYRLDISTDVSSYLEARLGDEQERVAVELAGVLFELRRMRSGKRLLARNDDIAVVIDPEGPEGWTVQIDCPGATMSRMSPNDAVSLSRRVANGLGTVKGERVRRLDLCADIAGWKVSDIDDRAWVKPSRARLERADVAQVEKMEHPMLRQYQRGSQITGYTICPGNVLSAVIYDKREELNFRPDKRETEEEKWRAGGWDGEAPVTRVEFRLRGEALHELGARDGLNAFRKKLDAIWGYCSRMWLRLVVRSTNERLSRCDIAPAWVVVRSAVFREAESPAARCRMRGGATAAQVFGAMLSQLAATKKQPPPAEVEGAEGEMIPVDGVKVTEKEIAEALSESDAERLVADRCALLFELAAAAVRDDLLGRFGPNKAAKFVLYRENAARARFAPATPAKEAGALSAAA